MMLPVTFTLCHGRFARMVVEIFGVRPKVDIAFTSPSMYGGTPAACMQGCRTFDPHSQQQVVSAAADDNWLRVVKPTSGKISRQKRVKSAVI